jgi:nitrogen fixation protein FixH
MEYKINIAGVPNVDLYADKTSAQNLVASVSGPTAAKKFVASAQFSDKMIKVKKVAMAKAVIPKKTVAKKAAIKKPNKAVNAKRKK